jgi:hypothetical protein
VLNAFFEVVDGFFHFSEEGVFGRAVGEVDGAADEAPEDLHHKSGKRDQRGDGLGRGIESAKDFDEEAFAEAGSSDADGQGRDRRYDGHDTINAQEVQPGTEGFGSEPECREHEEVRGNREQECHAHGFPGAGVFHKGGGGLGDFVTGGEPVREFGGEVEPPGGAVD